MTLGFYAEAASALSAFFGVFSFLGAAAFLGAAFLGAALVAGAALVTRPDLVLVRTAGFSSAGAWAAWIDNVSGYS